MKVIKYLLLIAVLMPFVSNAIMKVRTAISKSQSEYTIEIKGDDIFDISRSSLKTLAGQFFEEVDIFTFDSRKIPKYKNTIEQKSINPSLIELYNKQKSFLSKSISEEEIISSMRKKLTAIIDLFNEQVKALFIDRLTGPVKQDTTSSGLSLDISQENELTQPYRSLYNLVKNFCETIDVYAKPLETTFWKWGRRIGRTALYSTLLVSSAYAIYKLSDYLPYPETVGQAVATGLRQTGSGLQALEKTGKGIFGTIKFPKISISTPPATSLPTNPAPINQTP